MNVALKEWAIIVDALAKGKQIALLRKGGLAETRRGFELRYREFLLFPTFEHQHARFIKPEHQVSWGPSAQDHILIRHLAQVRDVLQAPRSVEDLRRLSDRFVWTGEYLRQRYEYRPDLPLFLIVIRVYRLIRNHYLPLRSSYAGCKSWVHLTEEIDIEGAEPVLPEPEFERACEALLNNIALVQGHSAAAAVQQ